MKRKIALLMLITLLLSAVQFNFVFADDDTEEITEAESDETIESDETVITELSMEDAVKLAKESSREMWKIDDGLKQISEARGDAKDAKKAAEAIMSIPLNMFKDLEVNPINNYVETLLAKNDYYITYANAQQEQLEKSKEVLEIGIEIEIKSLYYSVLADEKTIEINEAKLLKAEEQLRVVNLKFNNGSATKAEVLAAEMSVQQAQTDLDTANDDLDMAELNLLNKINLPLDTKITLTDKELTYVPISDVNLDIALEKAKAERPEIMAAENELELQKIETHVYKAYYTSNLREHKAAVKKLEDAELNVPQAYKDVELDVRKSYLKLVKSERALVNMDKTVEIAREAARINKLLYENGMVSSLDVLNADTQLAEAEIGRYKLLVLYNINKLTFDHSNLVVSMPEME